MIFSTSNTTTLKGQGLFLSKLRDFASK